MGVEVGESKDNKSTSENEESTGHEKAGNYIVKVQNIDTSKEV